jgi:hypothetical protein
MDYLTKAIFSLRPSAQFSFINEDYSTIKWDVLDGDAPSTTEIEAAIAQVKADEIANEAQKAADKAALLTQLGITADQAKLLLS